MKAQIKYILIFYAQISIISCDPYYTLKTLNNTKNEIEITTYKISKINDENIEKLDTVYMIKPNQIQNLSTQIGVIWPKTRLDLNRIQFKCNNEIINYIGKENILNKIKRQHFGIYELKLPDACK